MEITTVYSENHMKHVSTLLTDAELLIVKVGAPHSYDWTLKGYLTWLITQENIHTSVQVLNNKLPF
jgi:hypothetical protein